MPEVDQNSASDEVVAASRAAIEARNPIDVDVVSQAFLATQTNDLQVADVDAAVELFQESKPHLFVNEDAATEAPPAPSDEVVAAVRSAVQAASALDVDVVSQAVLNMEPGVTVDEVNDVVNAFAAQKPALFAQAKRSANNADRYIVEATTVFELLGSTVTFRESQIVQADSREYQIARDHDVPLRPLSPIKR